MKPKIVRLGNDYLYTAVVQKRILTTHHQLSLHCQYESQQIQSSSAPKELIFFENIIWYIFVFFVDKI